MTYTKRRLNRKKSIKRKNKKRTKMKGGANNDLFKDDRFITQHILHDTVLDTRLTLTLEHLIKICDKNPRLLITLNNTYIEYINLEPLTTQQNEELKQMLEDFKSAAAAKTDGDDETDGNVTQRDQTLMVVSAFSNGLRNNSVTKQNIKEYYLKKVYSNLWKINVERQIILKNECKQKIIKIICKKYFSQDISLVEIKDILRNGDLTIDDIIKSLTRFLNPTTGGGRNTRKSKKLKGGFALFVAFIVCALIFFIYFNKQEAEEETKAEIARNSQNISIRNA
jgi:hypothetical protein